MATKFAACKAFLEETRDRIVDIVPEHEPQIRFRPRTDAAIARGKFEEALRSPRMFQIENPQIVDVPMFGAGYSHERKTYDIRIWYPTTSGEIWRTAAESDAAKIRRDIMTSTTAVSGVQTRFIARDQFITFEELGDDPWFILTVPITVFYEFTG